jgi:hypothetical protein
MEEDTAVPSTDETLLAAFAAAENQQESLLYLRALLRRLEVNLGRVARDLHVLIERTSEVKP